MQRDHKILCCIYINGVYVCVLLDLGIRINLSYFYWPDARMCFCFFHFTNHSPEATCVKCTKGSTTRVIFISRRTHTHARTPKTYYYMFIHHWVRIDTVRITTVKVRCVCVFAAWDFNYTTLVCIITLSRTHTKIDRIDTFRITKH